MAEPHLLGRYVLEHPLGAGGYGEVFSAFDQTSSRRVALKRMRSYHPDDLIRFKREFRALAGISHPNLVCLYDLFTERGDYYLSMELIDGVPLQAYVRSSATGREYADVTETMDAPRLAPVEAARLSASSGTDRVRRRLAELATPPGELGLRRARDVFAQLADALAALHAGGMVHRDLKPSNVLVTRNGRVVVLDFGLVTDARADRAEHTRSMIGTPFYMAPEQAEAVRVGPAADLYAMGVMLYECLVGVTPFEGMSALEAIAHKTRSRPPDVRELVPGLPTDLAELCMALLAADPGARPTLAETRARLASVAPVETAHATPGSRSDQFVGRDAELDHLRKMLADAADGRTAFGTIEGESGMGKSALAERFLAWASSEGNALVLRGRCYENDALPNKLLDSVVDVLSAELARLPEPFLREVLPKDFAELARVFPVLQRFGRFVDARARAQVRDDPREARRFAELAFAELLGSLGALCPVVVFIDDVHWGDVESVGFLRALLDPRSASRLLTLLAFRAEERESSPMLKALFGAVSSGELLMPTRIEVGRLEAAQAEAMARALALDTRGAQLAAMVAREGRGHPLFIEELVRYVRSPTAGNEASPDSDGALGDLNLSDVIVRRVEAQTEETVRFLDALALIGVPVSPRVVSRTLGHDGVDATLLHRLRAEHLVRKSGADDDDLVACYHERIREALVGRMRPERKRQLHHDLAESLLAEPGSPASLIATHLHGAGESRRAAEHAFVAGEQAFASLAFGEACAFYSRALAWDPENAERSVRGHQRLGEARFSLGRCREAADAFLVAAEALETTDPRAALRLRTRAAEANLIGGDDARGVPMMRALLAEVGTTFPDSELGMKLRIGWNMLRLGTKPPNPLVVPREAPPEVVDRIDVLFAAQRSYVFRDYPRSMIFAMEGFREALKIGDAARIMEGISVYSSVTSIAEFRGAPMVLQATLDLAERLDTDFARGVAHLARGTDLFGRQYMYEALQQYRKAVDHLGRCAGVTPLRIYAEGMEILMLRFLEDFALLRRRSDETIRTARSLGNPYVEAVARHDSCVADLGNDDPGAALESIEAALAAVPSDDLYVVYSALHYRVKCHRYRGEWNEALATIEGAWGELSSRNLLANNIGKFTYGGLLVGSLLGVAAHDPARRRSLVRRARRAMRPFRAATSEWAVGYRTLLDAAAICLEGDAGLAAARCEQAATTLEAGKLPVFGATARMRAAQLVGEATGVARATEALRALGVKNPVAWTDSVAPGFVFVGG